MKFSIERGTLLKAVSQAQSVVERRNTIPILANVLIEAECDTVQFRATDLDIEVVDKAPAQVEKAGATTVSAVTLHEIVRKLPDGALVTLSEDGVACRLTVEAGRSNFNLATLPSGRARNAIIFERTGLPAISTISIAKFPTFPARLFGEIKGLALPSFTNSFFTGCGIAIVWTRSP